VLTSRNTGDAKGDTYSNIEGLIGSAQNDDLTGDGNDNTIKGGAGDDVIHHSGGNDTLWGDSETFGTDGADTFAFKSPGGGAVYIQDFDVFDHIQIDRAGFGLHPQWVLNVGTTLIISHANPTATTNSPTFLVEQSTGDLMFDADGNGSGQAVLIANVLFHSQEYLDQNDFVIV
jgi:Ca2+-binding RTX toxin-like protein